MYERKEDRSFLETIFQTYPKDRFYVTFFLVEEQRRYISGVRFDPSSSSSSARLFAIQTTRCYYFTGTFSRGDHRTVKRHRYDSLEARCSQLSAMKRENRFGNIDGNAIERRASLSFEKGAFDTNDNHSRARKP